MGYFVSDVEGHPEKYGQTTAKIPTSGIQPVCEKTGAVSQQDGAWYVSAQAVLTHRHSKFSKLQWRMCALHRENHFNLNC